MSTSRILPRRLCALSPSTRCRPPAPPLLRHLHSSPIAAATPLPITATGPPPPPPLPESSDLRHRANAKASGNGSSDPKRRRFWKDVHVAVTPDGYEIRLDKRALKTPAKRPLVIPRTKPLLAHAIALEWEHLRSTADATKSHLVPLTQLAARAIDMAAAEAAGDFSARADVVQMLLRYLDTDTLLCWAPTPGAHEREAGRPTLRETQVAASRPIVDWLTTRVWPGVEIRAVDGDAGIGGAGVGQSDATKRTVESWMSGLDTWRLVGLERTALASKSLLVGARLVAEWDEAVGEGTWGVKEACEVASLEVSWQTRMWGEVEDTHDVEKADLGRQVGAGWLMIVGRGPEGVATE